MKILVASLVMLVAGTAAQWCSAAIVVLPSGAVRVAITDDPLAGQPGWVRTNETIVNIFFGLAADADVQYLPGDRVQVYDAFQKNKVTLGVVLERPDLHDVRDQRGIYRGGFGTALGSGQSTNLLALQQPTAVPLSSDGTEMADGAPYVGPLALSAAVPEPGSLTAWLLLGAAVVTAAVFRRRRRLGHLAT